MARRKPLGIAVAAVVLAAAVFASLVATKPPPEPAFIAKLKGVVIGDKPMSRLRVRQYLFKASDQTVLVEMKRDLLPLGWKLTENRLVVLAPDQYISSWSFKKGKDSYELDPFFTENGTEVWFFSEMGWIERRWQAIQGMFGR